MGGPFALSFIPRYGPPGIHSATLPHPCRLAQAHSLHSLTIRFAYRRGLASSASLLSLNTRLVPPLTPHTRFTTFTRVWGRGPLIESLMKLLTKWGPHVLPLHSLHSFCSLTRGAGGTTPVTFPTLTSLTVVPPLARAQALALGSVPLTSPTGATLRAHSLSLPTVALGSLRHLVPLAGAPR